MMVMYPRRGYWLGGTDEEMKEVKDENGIH
jgi:hypothetical protein